MAVRLFVERCSVELTVQTSEAVADYVAAAALNGPRNAEIVKALQAIKVVLCRVVSCVSSAVCPAGCRCCGGGHSRARSRWTPGPSSPRARRLPRALRSAWRQARACRVSRGVSFACFAPCLCVGMCVMSCDLIWCQLAAMALTARAAAPTSGYSSRDAHTLRAIASVLDPTSLAPVSRR